MARTAPTYEFGLTDGDAPILNEALALAAKSRREGITEARQELEAGVPMADEKKAIRQQQLKAVKDSQRRLSSTTGVHINLTAGGVLLAIDALDEAEQAVAYDQICLENQVMTDEPVSVAKRKHLADKRQRMAAMRTRLAKQAAKRRSKAVRLSGRKSK